MKKWFACLAVLAVAAVLTGCSSSQTPGVTSTGFGAIEVRITDAPKYGAQNVVVYFSGVSVHKAGDESGVEGEWKELKVVEGYFDLVTLGKERLEALLAEDGSVATGQYTEIRVTIDEREGKGVEVTYTDSDDVPHVNVPAELASAELKFVHPFNVVDGTTTMITLDFDVEQSVVLTGASQDNDNEPKIMVRPVVKLTVEKPTPEPTVTSVTPSSEVQGQTLDAVITGTNLTGASAVSFGDKIMVNGFTINSNTQITANITIGADATVDPRDVLVTTPGGVATLDDGFTVKATV